MSGLVLGGLEWTRHPDRGGTSARYARLLARLERLGGKRVQKVQAWWVMRDPAGLLFCVLPMSPGSLNDENAQRWE